MIFWRLVTLLCVCCLQNGKAAQDISTPNLGPVFTFKGIETWKPSDGAKRKFPYYISGVDKEGRPVFVVEAGRWDYRTAVEGNGSDYEQMRRQISKGVFHLIQLLTGEDNEITPRLPMSDGEEQFDQVAFILDMEGFDYIQSASPRTMLFFFEIARVFSKLTDYVAYAQMINTNFVVETVLNAVKPALGTFSDKLEVSGTNKARWIQMLLKRIPRNQLPPWYGGLKGYKPAAVLGR